MDENETLREKPRVPVQGALLALTNIIVLDPLRFYVAKYCSAKSLLPYTFNFKSQRRHVPTCYV